MGYLPDRVGPGHDPSRLRGGILATPTHGLVGLVIVHIHGAQAREILGNAILCEGRINVPLTLLLAEDRIAQDFARLRAMNYEILKVTLKRNMYGHQTY